ncbi:hypothetical protein GCM10018952_13750 [Streptosporangium vulgare]
MIASGRNSRTVSSTSSVANPRIELSSTRYGNPLPRSSLSDMGSTMKKHSIPVGLSWRASDMR